MVHTYTLNMNTAKYIGITTTTIKHTKEEEMMEEKKIEWKKMSL